MIHPQWLGEGGSKQQKVLDLWRLKKKKKKNYMQVSKS